MQGQIKKGSTKLEANGTLNHKFNRNNQVRGTFSYTIDPKKVRKSKFSKVPTTPKQPESVLSNPVSPVPMK